MTLAFCWAYIAGQWLAHTNPIKIKDMVALRELFFVMGSITCAA